MEILKNPHFDLLGKARYFVAASLIVILSGLAYIAKDGLRYGVEFSGGTQVIAKFSTPPEVDHVRAAVNAVDSNAVIQIFGPPAEGRVLIRLAATSASETVLDADVQAVRQALDARYPENRVVEVSSEVVLSSRPGVFTLPPIRTTT